MFNWQKRDRPQDQPPAAPLSSREKGKGGEPLIAALLLDSITWDLAAAQQALTAGKIAGVQAKDVKVDKSILGLRMGDEMVFVAPMGVPYPWKDLEGPCETSWMWPPDKPATRMKGHKSHVLVTGIGGSADANARRVLLTHLVGRLVALPGVMGVYWPEATLVHYPPVFTKMAAIASLKAPPLYLWVDFRIFRDDGGAFGCFTTGLARIGLMEMEITGLTMPPGELRNWAINIAAYMWDRGSPIPNGDTVGATAEKQMRVRYGPSSFGAPGTVMRFGAVS